MYSHDYFDYNLVIYQYSTFTPYTNIHDPKFLIAFIPQQFVKNYSFNILRMTCHASSQFIVSFSVAECPQKKLLLMI